MAKYFGIDKVFKLLRMIKDQGGLRTSYMKLYRFDDFKDGKKVGEDKYGNKYFENPSYFYGRNRWVEYSVNFGMEYDGSQIPSDWYGWMHYKTDLPPHRDGLRPQYKWMADHSENLSGTQHQYAPYTTTTPKIEAWVPKGKN